MTQLPVFADVQAAAQRLAGHAVLTPVLRSDELDRRCGRAVFLKVETLQRTGTFKFRGAFNRLVQLNEEARSRGVVAFSSGNHAQGIALAGRLLGIPTTIVMPADAPQMKIDGTRALGGQIVLYDRARESREDIAGALAEASGATLVPAYDDPHVIAGQGTVGLEFCQQLAALGVTAAQIAICCGGGGLTAGCALAIKALSPDTQIITVEPVGFDDTARSLRFGKRESNAAAAGSICDALLAPQPGVLTFAINQDRVTSGLAVADDQVRLAIAFAWKHLKIVLEPGGAVTLAAALAGLFDPEHHSASPLGLVCSGGNVDAALFVQCLQDYPEA